MVYWPMPKVTETKADEIQKRRAVRGCRHATPNSTDIPFAARVSCMADLTSNPVEWLWSRMIPLGKITTLNGDAGVGKSLLSLRIAADVTRGRHAPHETCDYEAAHVLVISPEDDLVNIVGSRLQRADADLTHVHALRGLSRKDPKPDDLSCWLFKLNEDLRFLELEIGRRFVEGSPLRLVVIDPFPVELFHGPKGRAEFSRTIKHLAEIAAWSEAAVLLVQTSKNRRPTSVNIDADLEIPAHSAWSVVRDLDDSERRLLLPVKTNLAEITSGFSFRIESCGVFWEPESVDLTAEQHRAESLERHRTPLLKMEWSELSRAADWLQKRLRSNAVPVKVLKKEAAENDISFPTLKRAFSRLRGIARPIKDSRAWEWSLPKSVNCPTSVGQSGAVEQEIR